MSAENQHSWFYGLKAVFIRLTRDEIVSYYLLADYCRQESLGLELPSDGIVRKWA